MVSLVRDGSSRGMGMRFFKNGFEFSETRWTRSAGFSCGFSPKALFSVAFWVGEEAGRPRNPWAMLLMSLGACDNGGRVFVARHWF